MPLTLTVILQTAGPCLFLALQVSCILVANEIFRMKTVKKLSSVPFVSLLACGFYWSLYGWLKSDLTIFIPNAVSIGTGSYCMWVYYVHSSLKPDVLYISLAVFILFGSCLGLLGMSSAIGCVGCIMSVLMSGSPLAVVRTVIKEQNTASLPFSTSFVAWLNSCSWVAYGYFIAHDPMILMPNSLGLLLTTIQMSLFLVYGFSSLAPSGSFTGEASDIDVFENPYDV